MALRSLSSWIYTWSTIIFGIVFLVLFASPKGTVVTPESVGGLCRGEGLRRGCRAVMGGVRSVGGLCRGRRCRAVMGGVRSLGVCTLQVHQGLPLSGMAFRLLISVDI